MGRFIFLAISISAALGFSGSAAGMAAPAEVLVVNEPLGVDCKPSAKVGQIGP